MTSALKDPSATRDDREADAVDRDAVAVLGVGGHQRAGDDQAGRVVGQLRDLDDATEFLDDPGEHSRDLLDGAQPRSGRRTGDVRTGPRGPFSRPHERPGQPG